MSDDFTPNPSDVAARDALRDVAIAWKTHILPVLLGVNPTGSDLATDAYLKSAGFAREVSEKFRLDIEPLYQQLKRACEPPLALPLEPTSTKKKAAGGAPSE